MSMLKVEPKVIFESESHLNVAVVRSDARSPGFVPHVRQPSFGEICHEILSTAILSLPLLHVGQLSIVITDERMCTK